MTLSVSQETDYCMNLVKEVKYSPHITVSTEKFILKKIIYGK